LRWLNEVAGGSDDHLPLENQVGIFPESIKKPLVTDLLVEMVKDFNDPQTRLVPWINLISKREHIKNVRAILDIFDRLERFLEL
jgi:hypothetical protein